MANEANREEPQRKTVLIAQVTTHLNTGESIELLPFFDELDVKSKVTALTNDWAESGYLLKGRQIYPWHQVKLLEVNSVVEVSRSNSEEQAFQQQALEVSRLQQQFWKTKQAKEKPGEGEPTSK